MNNLNNDRPIEYLNEDRLNRIDYANSIAKILLSYKGKKLEEGLVFGLYGNWGSGKTSFINLIKECLEKNNQSKLRVRVFVKS